MLLPLSHTLYIDSGKTGKMKRMIIGGTLLYVVTSFSYLVHYYLAKTGKMKRMIIGGTLLYVVTSFSYIVHYYLDSVMAYPMTLI